MLTSTSKIKKILKQLIYLEVPGFIPIFTNKGIKDYEMTTTLSM